MGEDHFVNGNHGTPSGCLLIKTVARHSLHITLTLLLSLLLTGCGKEGSRLIEVTQEAYHSSKVLLSGVNATWAHGEMLLINATEKPILRQDHNGGNYAYIDAEALASTNRAIYPTSLSATALTSNSTEIVLPRIYHYRTSGGTQQIEMPMAAYCTSSEGPLNFKHLTAGIYFTIKNSTGHDLTLDSLTVISSGYSLSGSRTINFADIEGHGSVPTTTVADRTVALVFDQQATLLADGEECVAFLPIAAVGADNHFTVRATGHYQGRRYTKVLTQETGGALGRNQIAYTEIAIEDAPYLSLFSGKGSEEEPFLIGSAYEFQLMLDAMSHSEWNDIKYNKAYSKHCYRLTADIDLAGATISPIASYSGAKFDGGGHTVSNATIVGTQASTTGYCGLFDWISSPSTISDLNLDHITLRYNRGGSDINVGALAGRFGGPSVSGCHVSNITYDIAPTSTPHLYLGGIVGHVSTSSRNVAITNCSYVGSPSFNIATNEFYMGGIVGLADEMSTKSLTITHCQATTAPLTISGSGIRVVGGLVGKPNCKFTLTNSSWRSGLDITSGSSNAVCGGLVGRLTNNTYTYTFDHDTVAGSIAATSTSESYAGAYIGSSTPNPSFTDCDRSGITSITVNGAAISNDIGDK